MRYKQWLSTRLIISTFILLTGFILTYWTWSLSSKQNEALGNNEFEYQVESTTRKIEQSLDRYFNVLVELQSLFHASDEVTRVDFQNFIRSMEIKKKFPGVQGISWSALVSAENSSEYEKLVQSDKSLSPVGYPQFLINPPETLHNDRMIVSFVEPMEGNESAFGFDIGTNPARREAVEAARDTGHAVATAPIRLVHEQGNEKGVLYMVPAYTEPFNGSSQERSQSFEGVVVAVFRVKDMISDLGEFSFDAFTVSDTTSATLNADEMLLYSKGTEADGKEYSSTERSLQVGGREWRLTFSHDVDGLSKHRSVLTRAVVILGLVATVMASLLSFSLATSLRELRRSNLLAGDLKEVNGELNRSNSELYQFAHVASHDLQVPTRHILGGIELLEESIAENEPETTSQCLGAVRDAALRMQVLLSDLLLHAQIGQMTLKRESVNFNEMINDIRKLLTEDIVKSNATISLEALPELKVDRIKMERVFQNLINNAIKYQNVQRAPLVKISAGKTGTNWSITITDNGMGIDDQYWEKVFEPFSRLHSQNQIPGTGLGLGICRKIVEQHGGSISIVSSGDSGSIFEILLPFNE